MAVGQSGLLDPLDEVIKETMENKVDKFAGGFSSFWRDLTRSDQNVETADWGRSYIIKKTFRKGLAGAFHWGNTLASGTTALAPDDALTSPTKPNFGIFGRAAQQGWPGPDVATTVGYFNWQIGLAKAYGNLFIPLEVKRAASLSSSIANQANHTVEATAEHVARNLCNAFMAETVVCTGTTYDATLDGVVIGEIDLSTSIALASAGSAEVTLIGGSIRRFFDGMPLDIILWDKSADTLYWINCHNAAGTIVQESTVPFYCQQVDSLANTMQIVNITGKIRSLLTTSTATDIPDVAAGDRAFLIPHKALMGLSWANSTSLQTCGIIVVGADTSYHSNMPVGVERILKSSGTLYGSGFGAATSTTAGIDLTRHPEFKTYEVSVGAALDEGTLIRLAARLEHARGSYAAPDSFYCSEGVFASLVDNLDVVHQMERNGKAINVELGVDEGAMFRAFGRVYALKTDSFLGVGKLYGVVQRNNNWKRYVPPKCPGTQTHAGFDGGVEFVVPALTGGNSIFQGVKTTGTSPAYPSAAGQTTDMLEAPFWMLYQIVPDVLPGLKLTDITEDYGATG